VATSDQTSGVPVVQKIDIKTLPSMPKLYMQVTEPGHVDSDPKSVQEPATVGHTLKNSSNPLQGLFSAQTELQLA
jgi:hypothetical protein